MSAGKTRIRHWRLAATISLAAVLLTAPGLHAYALFLERTARDSTLSLDRRDSSASRAAALEPWNRSFEVTRAIVTAQSLLVRGQIDRAYTLLLPYSASVRDDALFRETYQEAVARKWALDARKAHQQHAREKEDGALDPEDVFE